MFWNERISPVQFLTSHEIELGLCFYMKSLGFEIKNFLRFANLCVREHKTPDNPPAQIRTGDLPGTA